MASESSPSPQREIPRRRGCSDPSAGAVILSEVLALRWESSWKALQEDPAVAIEAIAFAIPPLLGVIGATWALTTQRAAWRRRQFSSTVIASHLSFRKDSSATASVPTLLLRTLGEQPIEIFLPNEHGRTELLRAARKYACTDTSVQWIHLKHEKAAQLVSNQLLNSVSSLFCTGFLQRDILPPSKIHCQTYGVGLACSEGPAGGTKLRMVVASLPTIQQAAALAQEPLYEHPEHGTAFSLLLCLHEALRLEEEDSTSENSEEGHQAFHQRFPAISKGIVGNETPIVARLELCVPVVNV